MSQSWQYFFKQVQSFKTIFGSLAGFNIKARLNDIH